MAKTVSLSSAGTATIILDPVRSTTSVQVTLSSASSGAFQVEVSLDDPSLVGGPTATWSPLSSGLGMVSSNVVGNGLLYTVLSPLGGVRINSSSNVGTITLKAHQSVTA
jgi:hypothetical protein